MLQDSDIFFSHVETGSHFFLPHAVNNVGTLPSHIPFKFLEAAELSQVSTLCKGTKVMFTFSVTYQKHFLPYKTFAKRTFYLLSTSAVSVPLHHCMSQHVTAICSSVEECETNGRNVQYIMPTFHMCTRQTKKQTYISTGNL